MEIKINREIRNYTVFRTVAKTVHFFCPCVWCGSRIVLFAQTDLGTETVSWVCILGAAPFAALGFVKYNGMTAEKFIWADGINYGM